MYDPAEGLYGDDPVPLAHWDFTANEKNWSTILYYAWGVMLTW